MAVGRTASGSNTGYGPYSRSVILFPKDLQKRCPAAVFFDSEERRPKLSAPRRSIPSRMLEYSASYRLLPRCLGLLLLASAVAGTGSLVCATESVSDGASRVPVEEAHLRTPSSSVPCASADCCTGTARSVWRECPRVGARFEPCFGCGSEGQSPALAVSRSGRFDTLSSGPAGNYGGSAARSYPSSLSSRVARLAARPAPPIPRLHLISVLLL